MKRFAALTLSALLTVGAFAGVTSTEQPTQYLIRLADKTYEQNKAAPKTHDECLTRAQAIIPAASCVTIESFANIGNCDGVAKPAIARELDADGYVVKPPIRGKQLTDTDWTTEIQDYVPAPYPACWVLGWREITENDLNDEFSDELANSIEPVRLTPELQAAWDASCAERHRAHVYYPEDTCA